MPASNGWILSKIFVVVSATYEKFKIFAIHLIYQCCIHTNNNGWNFSYHSSLNVLEACSRCLKMNNADQDYVVNYQECGKQVKSLIPRNKNSNYNNGNIFTKLDCGVFLCDNHQFLRGDINSFCEI